MVASAQAQEVARAILARAPPGATSQLDVGLAADRIAQVLGAVLARWIGAAGHGALLERALRDAVTEHPLLQGLRLDDDRIVDDAPDGPPGDAGSVTEAMIVLLGAYLDRLGRVVGTEMAARLTAQAFAGTQGEVLPAGPLAASDKGE